MAQVISVTTVVTRPNKKSYAYHKELIIQSPLVTKLYVENTNVCSSMPEKLQ